MLPKLTSCILGGDLCCLKMRTWQVFIKVQVETLFDGWSMDLVAANFLTWCCCHIETKEPRPCYSQLLLCCVPILGKGEPGLQPPRHPPPPTSCPVSSGAPPASHCALVVVLCHGQGWI